MKKHFSLTQRCITTLAALIFIRILCSVPTPGVNTTFFKFLIAQNASLGFINSLAGSGLSNLSIMALGITPYISSTIILQLLGVIFQMIQDLSQGMEAERRLYEKITFSVSILIAMIQSFGMALTFGKSGMLIEYQWYWVLSTTVIWTMTSTLLSYAGKKMGEKPEYFLGNGISLILASNILSSFPSDFVTVWEKYFAGKSVKEALLSAGVVLAVTAVILILTIFSQEAKKDISVLYAVKVNTSGKEKEESGIPIKLCSGSVIPIIFASSILTFPVMIGTFLGKEDFIIFKLLNSSNWFP